MDTRISIIVTLLLVGLFAGCGQEQQTQTKSTPPSDSPETSAAAPAEMTPSQVPEEAPAPAIDLDTLAAKTDFICKMSLEEYPPATTAEYKGKTYGFCSTLCRKKFLEAPEKMLARLESVESRSEGSE